MGVTTMLNSHSYYDLNIMESCIQGENLDRTLKILHNFGYRTIAVTQVVEDVNIEPKKKKKKGESRDVPDCVPSPLDIESISRRASELGLRNFTVLNRLTVIFSSQDTLQKILKSPNYKKYHIVAVLPTTQSALMFTCSTLDADILTIDPQNKSAFKINRRLYNQLLDKGYNFELLYSPAIADSTQRKNVIFTSHLYHSVGKSRNIIFSSGATDYMLLRSPYDVISLGFIFGLSELQCKSAVSHCPRSVIVNSVGRRHGKAVMFVDNIESDDITTITIDLGRSEDEDMETDEPAQKKSKQ